MKDGSSPQHTQRAWLFFTLGLVLIRALPNLRFPIGRDQATFCLLGQGLWDGQLLYSGLYDNKPPGIFLFYAPFVKLLGPVMWVAAVADFLVVLVAACLLFRFASRHLGAPAAALGTLAAASFHSSAGYINAAQTEGLLLIFVLAACALLTLDRPAFRLRSFSAGTMLAAAFWVKYNALAFIPFVALIAYLDWGALNTARPRLAFNLPLRDVLIRAAIVAAGFAALSVLVLANFWFLGSWEAFRETQFDVLLRYRATGLEQPHFASWAVGGLYFYAGPWNHAAIAIALLAAWKQRELGRIIPCVLGFAAAIGAILLSGRVHSYYVELLYPFYGLCWAYVAVAAFRAFRSAHAYFVSRGFQLARALGWLAVANFAFALVFSEAMNMGRDYKGFAAWVRNPSESYEDYFPQHSLDKFSGQLKVIEYLRANSSETDQVFVWGTAPLIYFLGERASPSRFVANLALISPWGPSRWRDELVRDLSAKSPLYIVVARHDAIPTVSSSYLDSEQMLESYPLLAGLIASRYERAAHFRDFDIYRRK